MSANQELGDQFYQLTLDAGTVFDEGDVLKLGAVDVLLRFLALAFYDGANDQPAVGVMGAPGTGTYLTHLVPAKGAGDLDWTVEPGVLFQFVSGSVSNDDFLSEAFNVGVLETQATGTLSTHDATNPRIDVVYATFGTTEDSAVSRETRAADGNLTSPTPTQNIRRKRTLTIAIATGTPGATPSAPSIPAGAYKIGEFEVPATSGPITRTNDHRDFIGFGEAIRGVPPRHIIFPHVIEATNVSYLSGTTVQVAEGTVVAGGIERRVPRQVHTLASAPSGNDRIDVLYVSETGALTNLTGTPGATPTAPTPPNAECVLAEIYQNDGTGPSSGSDITDIREFGAVGVLRDDTVDTASIQDDAITQAKIASASRTIAIHGNAFDSPDNTVGKGSVLTFPTASTTYQVYAGLQLPHGATITSFGAAFFGNGGGGTSPVEVQIYRSQHTADSGGGLTQTISAAASGTMITDQTVRVTGTPTVGREVVDNETYAYGIRVECTPSVNLLCLMTGAFIVITTDQHLS